MRLVGLKIANFRCYRDETLVDLSDMTVFVGKNDSGKSSLFDALNVFFDDKAVPEKDDVCVYGSGKEVRITCVFDNLPTSLVLDAQHPTSLKDEYLLNSNGYLEIVKVYDCGLAKPKCSGVYARALHPTVDSYADLLLLTNTLLKQRANSLGVDLRSVNQTVNTELRRAIWCHAPDLQLEEVCIELKAEAAKAMWDQLKALFPVFAVFKSDRPSTDQDSEAQDPLRAAVKEAIKAQQAALEQIAEKVTVEVQSIADRTVEKIAEMDPALARQLKPRVTTKPWDSLFSVSLTGDDDIPINKRGSGTRRLVLLNFFRARAEQEAEEKGEGVIYAIEEPETSQHPHNQVMLVKALEDLVERPGCQVLLTTHTPVLARRFDQNDLRLVTRENGHPVVLHGRDDKTLKEIVDSLGVLPDHDIMVFFGVEGPNDIEFLRAISKVLHDAGEDVVDLGEAENQGRLLFVPLGGSCLDLWVSRLAGLNRPEFYLFDRDVEPPAPPRYEAIAAQMRERPNCTVWHTEKRELENYICKDLISGEYPGYKGSGDPFEDVPLLFARAVHEAASTGQSWEDVCSNVDKVNKKVSKAKRRICGEFAAKMTPELLSRSDPDDEILSWLRTVSDALRSGELIGGT